MKRLIFLLLLSSSAYAQQRGVSLVAEAPLDGVQKDGFYTVSLPPGITALLTRDMGNIRILDEDSVEVPYVANVEKPDYAYVDWKPFKMEKEKKNGCCTIVKLFNEDKAHIDNFLLEVKNAEINKTARLRGSDDGETWYALAENIQLSFGHLKSNSVIEVFDFPLSNYAYYQLTINDSTTSPLNVVRALRTREDIIHGMFVEIPNVFMSSKDSVEDHATWATIQFDTAQYVDRLEFDVDGPHLFKRHVKIFREVEYFVKKKKNIRLEELTSFDVISGQARPVYVYTKERKLLVRVENDDNQPLKIDKVAAYQLKHSLIAWLEAKHTYRLVMGEDEMNPPVYDLAFFKDSIPANPTEIEVGKLRHLATQKPDVSPTFFTEKKVIWIAIILVAAVLAGMSVRMLKDKELKERN